MEGAGGLSGAPHLPLLAIRLDPPLYNRSAGGLSILAAGTTRCHWREDREWRRYFGQGMP